MANASITRALLFSITRTLLFSAALALVTFAVLLVIKTAVSSLAGGDALAFEIAVLQIEDRHTPMIDAFIAHNGRQASRQQGIHHVVNTEGIADLPPYWWKVFGLQRLMAERSGGGSPPSAAKGGAGTPSAAKGSERSSWPLRGADLVMWLDSDAYLTPDAAKNVRELARDGSKIMWLSPDAPRFDSPFCAGSFVIRNDERGRRLVDDWAALYDPDRWEKDAETGAWRAKGEWAGPDYEQGAFTLHLLSRPEIASLPWCTFSEVECGSPCEGSISVHLAGPYKDERWEACADIIAKDP